MIRVVRELAIENCCGKKWCTCTCTIVVPKIPFFVSGIVIFKNAYEAANCLLHCSKPIAAPKDKPAESAQDMEESFDYSKVDQVPHEMIAVAMPPGHVWRFAAPCASARGILMRYPTTYDRKQEKSERLSEYYRNFGNPNYGGKFAYHFYRFHSSHQEVGSTFGVACGIAGGLLTKRMKRKREEDWISETFGDEGIPLPRPARLPGLEQEIPNGKEAWTVLSERWSQEEHSTQSPDAIVFREQRPIAVPVRRPRKPMS